MGTEPAASFATLTHARLRAAQGDVAGATRILGAILDEQPEHGEARVLLAELAQRVDAVRTADEDEVPGAVSPTTAEDLRLRFRAALAQDPGPPIGRLSRWLDHAIRNRGARRVL